MRKLRSRTSLNSRRNTLDESHIRELLVEVQQRWKTPVDGIVPDVLQRHDVRVPEQRILVLDRSTGCSETASETCSATAVPTDRSVSREILLHQTADHGVADRDVVDAGRVERVEKHTGFTGQRPAIRQKTTACNCSPTASWRKNLAACLGVEYDHLGQKRLMAFQPLQSKSEIDSFPIADETVGRQQSRYSSRPMPAE